MWDCLLCYGSAVVDTISELQQKRECDSTDTGSLIDCSSRSHLHTLAVPFPSSFIHDDRLGAVTKRRTERSKVNLIVNSRRKRAVINAK
jgi:hypothetical protein